MPKVCASQVLLVDDDPSIRELLSQELEEAGFEARQAEDGIDALVKLRKELPKVIISDLQMPRMSGFEFIGVVRQRFPSIPVVVLSGSMPNEFPAEAKPEAWFEKGALNTCELLRVLGDLARRPPDATNLPKIASTPARVRPGYAGYFMLDCPDCLRTFRATFPHRKMADEQTTVCVHCRACVPFSIETSTSHVPPTTKGGDETRTNALLPGDHGTTYEQSPWAAGLRSFFSVPNPIALKTRWHTSRMPWSFSNRSSQVKS